MHPPKTAVGSGVSANLDVDTPPGYIESLMLKIGNNINVKVENLILKYVENDIVLSLNIKSIHLQPATDENWEAGWVEVTPEDSVVRRIINVEDLTVCLDRRAPSSGQIEFYEEPVLYRCGIAIRMISSFSHSTQRQAASVKISAQLERLSISISGLF